MSIQLQPGDAIFHQGTRILCYRNPAFIHQATRIADVLPCLNAVAEHVAQGHTAVGFLAYEAAPAFDPALRVHTTTPEPLCWFGIYETFDQVAVESIDRSTVTIGEWTAHLDESAYLDRVATIRELIAAGDTYQVNYTFPLRASFEGDTVSWFLDCAELQRAAYSTLIHMGDQTIVSISPELFFQKSGDTVTMRPMKGTARRGLWPDDDDRRARDLAASEKERAENLMIVDMVRNDLGRIARTNTVHTERLFEVERYPTLWQMTSTVTARTDASVPEIFRALFPSASVTGAPKVRTMQIIRDLEPEPRGIYCGAVGLWTQECATFSVAIRTAVIDHTSKTVRYAVGSGVTWDSSPSAEYSECLLKADVVHTRPQPFELLETIRWENGFSLLDEHTQRLMRSADYFGIPLDKMAVLDALHSSMPAGLDQPQRVRLLVNQRGGIRVEWVPLGETTRVRVRLDNTPTPSRSPFLYHKTTRRAAYEQARQRHPDADDVILYNERGELTESTIANLVLRIDGVSYTPPIQCGLLPGTMRAHLLDNGTLHERTLYPNDLQAAESIHLINSLRGWIDVEIIH